MSFYIIVGGHITEHDFEYLKKVSGRRLEATVVPGQKAQPRDLLNDSQSFAIEIMSKSLEFLDQDCSIEEALKVFKTKSVHHLPITKKGVLKGLISDRDVLWLEKFDLTKHSKLSEFMSKTILCCHEETPIEHLAKVMVNEQISALPVINKDDELVGIVTHHDILRWIYDF
ncbi:MAG: CBS domain-containing protein [Bacteriovoracaceae bacterium]|nr:CBS domain-containing protein [Bacteriovoracaceae bacterium]